MAQPRGVELRKERIQRAMMRYSTYCSVCHDPANTEVKVYDQAGVLTARVAICKLCAKAILRA
jgi:hypothetical protein